LSLLYGWLGSLGAKGDDLLLVDDGAGVVQRWDDVVARELRVGVQDLLRVVAAPMCSCFREAIASARASTSRATSCAALSGTSHPSVSKAGSN
jgi:hypothetical protein